MSDPKLTGYTSSPPPPYENVTGDVSNSGKGMEMSYSPVHTDSEGSPSKLPPVEVVDGASNGKAEKLKNGHTKGSDNGDKPNDGEEGKKKKEDVKMVGTFEMFRFAKCFDVCLMIIGTLAASVHGAALPCMILVFGNMVDTFVGYGTLTRILEERGITFPEYYANQTIQSIIELEENLPFEEPPDLLEMMRGFAIYYIIIACVVIFVGYLQVSMWATAAERQTKVVRTKFFHNILRQEIGWFDTHDSGELNTRLSDDINKIREGIGDKVGSFFQWFAAFLAGFIIGFVKGWKLTLVIMAVSPLLALAAFLMTKMAASMTSLELKAYAKAGAVAEEVLSSVRTVVAFGGENKESDRYNGNLIVARDTGVKKSMITGLCMGFIWLVVFGSYALGFWYGSKLVLEESGNYTSGNVLVVFFSVIIGAFSLGNAAPSLQSLAAGRGAAYIIFQLIDQEPAIDSSSTEGKTPTIKGKVQFSNVRFTYPSRPDTKVLQGMSFEVNVGQTVALVGASGCGKSTTVQLIQRFYDPSDGVVLVDNVDLPSINVKHLRENIGVVSQEPILFGTTIAENIRYGRLDISQEQIESVSKEANAHDFIMQLPNKYETMVGDRGAQLSGGQKQRVAIARALARNPKILLLDEATSALDMESESIVQEALEKASHGRTTLVIAHRLSTVRGADKIVGIRDGVAVEQGTHEELMKIEDGVYSNLVKQQTKHFDEGNEYEEFEAELEQPMSPKRELNRLLSSSSLKKGKSPTDAEEEEEEKLPDPPMIRLFKMNSPEWYFIVCGCLASIVNGGVQPAFAILFAEILGVWSLKPEDQPPKIMMFSLILLGLGLVSFFTMFLQGFMFGKSGEHLTLRVRQLAFRSILKQEVAWFDDHKNSTGALTTRLATDASQVQGATGVRIGGLMQALANIGTAIIIAFVYSWRLTLVILAFLPFIAIAGFIEMQILTGVGGKDKEALEGAGKVASEAIENIRTVSSLTREPVFHQSYINKILQPYKAALKKGHVYGLAFGFSQAIIFFAYAASFYYGAYLITIELLNYKDLFKVFSAIVFGAMGLGQATAFAPDYAKAKVSAARIFALFDRVPAIDSSSTDGEKLQEGAFQSSVVFKDVMFSYPTRPGVTVLKGFNISVKPGQTLALVGSSGCGKSTTVSLIERFYDALDGQVCLDQHDVKDLNLPWLRRQVGIVSQEPALFDCSIADNIAYGDNSRKVGMDEIITAARNANIHNFIQSLPTGYDTTCGDKGTQLSGGQKQRVAIARALVRNPKILLLDEATSALDTESEQIVQEALDKAREGRTCVVIAHRLSTIQNADKICVIHHGHVMEEGGHAELMAKQGFYYRLQMIQQRKS